MKESSNGLLIPNQDIVFQALFGTKGSEKILGGFLSNILGEKVDNISLDANQNLVREIPENKFGIVDLRANIGDGSTVHIEVQMVDPYNMFKRLLWYWSRIYGVQLKESEDYSILKRTISILIVNYNIKGLELFKEAHTKWNMLEKSNLNVNPFEDIEIHIIELPKIKKYKNQSNKVLDTGLEFLSDPESEEVKMDKEKDEGLNAWLEFLVNPESERVKMRRKKDKILNEAYQKLEYISGDEDLRRRADSRLMAALDENSKRNYDLKVKKEIEEGRKELEKGQEELEKGQEELEKGQEELEKEKEQLKKEKEKLVQNLLKMNVDINDIAQATGLSIEQIKSLTADK